MQITDFFLKLIPCTPVLTSQFTRTSRICSTNLQHKHSTIKTQHNGVLTTSFSLEAWKANQAAGAFFALFTFLSGFT